MAFKVEVMEKATIKPSSPTPHRLKSFKLSLIDQFFPPVTSSIILFYSTDQQSKNEEQLDLLKRSLSETLTHFYPLAGRINGNQYIDCNDEGVNFFKTQVSSELSQVINNPKAEELLQLLPTDNFSGLGPKVLLSIQANVFNCGGIAIGVQIFHKAADASALSLLLCNRASIARGSETHLALELDNTSLFPPLDFSPPSPSPQDPSPNLVSKRFIFSGSNIAALKEKTCSIQVPTPTKVEAVMALIWRCFMRAESVKVITSFASIAVNLRGKMVPPVLHHFGNLLTYTTAESNMEQSEPELPSLVVQLRESIRKIDGDYCEKHRTHDGFWAYLNSKIDMYKRCESGEAEVYSFTSWCRFPFYETDFGWGKPVWASFAHFTAGKLVALMDTECGNGIEAWVTLDNASMRIFETDPELISFTSINHSQDLADRQHEHPQLEPDETKISAK